MLDFFKTVWPGKGPYCVVFRTQEQPGKEPGDKPKKKTIHKAVADYGRATKMAAWGLGKGFDVYFCISSLKDLQWVNPETGKPHIRKKPNMAKTKVFILDVDVDYEGINDKKYLTQDAALEGLAKFCGALALPKPIVVSSGYGLHCYWVLSKPIPSHTWEEVAEKFKLLAVKLDSKLAADTSRISDSAGILRVPGTKNFKREPAKAVTIIQWSDETVEPMQFLELIKNKAKELGMSLRGVRKASAPAAKEKSSVSIDLSLDTPHRLEPVLKKCNWMKQYVKGIATASEVEWYRVLGLVKHLYHPKQDMRGIVHAMSRGHPGYSYEETELKFNQVRAAQSGPTMCSTFNALSPDRCAGCPYANLVTTPARLDEVDLPDPKGLQLISEYTDASGETVQASVELVPIPKPYFRGANGGIFMNVDGGSLDGETDPNKVRKIYEYDIFPVSRLQNEDTGEEEIEVHLNLPMDGKRIIRVPNQVVIEPKTFAGYLTARGVLLKPHEVQPLVSYMVDYTRVIQSTYAAQGVFNRFGWRNPQELGGALFVLGDGVINNEGEFKACMTAPWLTTQKDSASGKGSLREWVDAFDVIRTHSPVVYQVAASIAFAAPLFALTPYHGMIFNMLGRSGAGKSTALKFMTSVFGKPTFTHVLKKDNSIPIFNKIGYLNSIAVAYDEITLLAPDQTADLAYGVTEGRGKERADRNGQTRINYVKWDTAVVSCSNLSLYEKIGQAKQGNAAPAYRVFETLVDEKQVKSENRPRIEAAIRVLENNYGIVGRLFIQHVMKNRAQIIEQLVKKEEELTRQFEMKTAERYWGAMFATLAVSIEICNRLGFHQLDHDLLMSWMNTELNTAREKLNASQGHAVDVLTDYINSSRDKILILTDGVRPNAIGSQSTPSRQISIRIDKNKEGKIVGGAFASRDFKTYCEEKSIEYGWITGDLKDMGIIKASNSTRIAVGTEVDMGTTHCWVFVKDSSFLRHDIQQINDKEILL